MARNRKRREFLVGVGAAGIAGFAGCIGGGDGGSNGSGGGGGTSGGGSGSGGSGGGGNGSGGGGGGSSGGGGGRTIRVGVLQPTTGDLASVGEPIQQAALLPATQLSDANIGFTIDAQAEDAQTDPQAAISAAQALVDGGYPSITGAASSEVTIQVAQNVAIPNQTVMCSPASTSPAITTLDDNGYVFRTCPSDALQSQVLAQVASQRVGASSVSVMFTNGSYGQSLADAFVQAYEGEVPAQVSFEQAQSTYTSKLQQAMSSSPDGLLVIGYPESGNQLFRDYYSNYGRDTTILVTDGLRDPELPGNVGQSMTNVIGTAPLAAGPAQEFFTQSFQDEYGSEPGVFTAQAYDATAVQILANAAAGENSGTAVQEQMTNMANPGGTEVTPQNLADGIGMAANGDDINYQGASSTVNFDDNGDMQSVAYEIFAYTESGDIEQQDTVQFEAGGGSGGGGNGSATTTGG
jgi:ABC-type branched-subunit amino acid transport system substrate-binding protein